MPPRMLTLIASGAFLLPASVFAQDAPAPDAAELGWTGSGELGAFQSSGNTKSIGGTAGLALTKESENWRLKLRALGDYQRTNGVTSREQAVAAFEPNYKINERLYAYGLGQYERDKFQGFSSRFTASGGLGYQVIKTERTKLDVKVGPAWRKTNFVSGGSTSSIAGLLDTNFGYKISPTVTFTQDTSAYVESKNSSLLSLTGINAKLSDKLTARLSYQVDHETKPPVGLKKTDTLTRFTLLFGF